MISAVCQGLFSCRRHIGKREDPGDEVGDRHVYLIKVTADQPLSENSTTQGGVDGGLIVIRYRKIPKISPGAYIFQRPFLSGLFLEGLIFGGAYLRREICAPCLCTTPCWLKGNLKDWYEGHLFFFIFSYPYNFFVGM